MFPIRKKRYYVFDHIKKNIKWNGENGILASKMVRDQYQKLHSGNVADVNLLLVSFLRKAGLNAWPIVSSTRDNGLLLPYFPSMDQLNYVMAYVKFGDEGMILDATDEDIIPNVVPERCLSGQAWLVDEGYGVWIDLLNDNKSTQRSMTKIGIDENGEWIATINISHDDYDYLSWIDDYKSNSSSKGQYEKFLDNKYSDLEIMEYELIKHNPEELKSSEKMVVNLNNSVDDLGNELVLDPFLFDYFDENPFKSESRKYPVDLIYPATHGGTIILSLPTGYSIKSVPESIRVSTPNNGLKFTFLCQAQGNSVQIRYSMEVVETVYSEEQYVYLRNIYSVIIDKFNEYIQISKT